MALHHRPEISDMRHAYDRSKMSPRKYSSDSDGERSYQEAHSDSVRSYQTQPMSYSSSPRKQSPYVSYNTNDSRRKDVPQQYFDDRLQQESPQSSIASLASTVGSEEELQEETPAYDVQAYTSDSHELSAIPSTPSDFSELFPSKRRLAIRHDDSTVDGNMNLRIDTEVNVDGERCDMTLFHLRMHDLKNRDFSLRRYCRDSGREVCHFVRKSTSSSEKRPAFHRSLSNALNSMRPKSERKSSANPSLASLKRNDSGYGSMHSVDFDEDNRPPSSGQDSHNEDAGPPNLMKLEFSNYAQVQLKRNGSKRHEFEYWGINYTWKRVSRKDRGHKDVSYHLTKSGSDRVLAYIVPVHLTPRQSHEEQKKGGWIPPCSMWIADNETIRSQKDVSDVVVASGLMALVDDSIRARFPSEDEKQLLIPVPKFQIGVEYVGPKRLISEIFNKKNSSQSRPTSSGAAASGMRTPVGSARNSSHEY